VHRNIFKKQKPTCILTNGDTAFHKLMLVCKITFTYFTSEIQLLGSYILIKLFLKKKSIRTEHYVSRVQEGSN